MKHADKLNKRFLFLAKLGIIESNNEKGEYQIQRIDSPTDFAIENNLSFYPPLLSGDTEAQIRFKRIPLKMLNNIKI